MCSMRVYLCETCCILVSHSALLLLSYKVPCLPPGVDAIALPSCAQCVCTSVKRAAYSSFTLHCRSVKLQGSLITTRCGCHRPSLMCSLPLYWLNVLHTCLTLCTLQCCSVKLQGSVLTTRCGCHRSSLMCSMPLYWLNVLHTCLTLCSAALFSCKIPCLPPGVDAIALPSCAQCLCTG